MEATHSLLLDSGVPDIYWPEGLKTVLYILNRTPKRKCAHSPHEQAFGRRPSIEHFRVFGCAAYSYEPNPSDKLAPRAEKCVLIGDDHNQSYRLLHPWKGTVARRRDVRF